MSATTGSTLGFQNYGCSFLDTLKEYTFFKSKRIGREYTILESKTIGGEKTIRKLNVPYLNLEKDCQD